MDREDDPEKMKAWAHAVARELAEITDPTKVEINRIKIRMAGEFGLNKVPKDSELFNSISNESKELLGDYLSIKKTRSASGVAVVAVMTSPADCPHGRCVPCPGGRERGVPQSYTGYEPAARRAIDHDFDPESQVKARIQQLRQIGHSTDKVDLIIMGGTFTAREPGYQREFVEGCFDGLNEKTSPDLATALKLNENAPNRCVGLTVETRPDHFLQEEIAFSRSYGTTRVELGVQSIRDPILRGIKRGHGVDEVKASTRLAKEAGLKVCYHMMPGLPGTTLEEDGRDLLALFSDPNFQPDMLKIYPTLVVPGSKLNEMWEKGEYEPPGTDETVEMLARVKPLLPPYVRIQRIERDIPVDRIAAGIERSDLRMLVKWRMEEEGRHCTCIRCREAGLNQGNSAGGLDKPALRYLEYRASRGREIFFSYETEDHLHAYLRLRFDGNATVRELKVVGTSIPIGEKGSGESGQHLGYGSELLRQAERKAAEEGFPALRITSGVGVRPYYRDRGYNLENEYMVKNF